MLQTAIQKLTNNGDLIAHFLVQTMLGTTPHAKVCHQLQATKLLIKFGFTDLNTNDITHTTPQQHPTALPDSSQDHQQPTTITPTHILNYEIARYIRQETSNGENLARFLVEIMHKDEPQFSTQTIKPQHRIAAAKELLNRGFGNLNPNNTSRQTTLDQQDHSALHTDLAKHIRAQTGHGIDTARFLIEVVQDGANSGFKPHHRLSAASELLRRAYDIPYEHISWQHIEAYYKTQTPPDAPSIEEPSPTLAPIPTDIDPLQKATTPLNTSASKPNYPDTPFNPNAETIPEDTDTLTPEELDALADADIEYYDPPTDEEYAQWLKTIDLAYPPDDQPNELNDPIRTAHSPIQPNARSP